jgi:ribA/ribD-fused uncharacterized protein
MLCPETIPVFEGPYKFLSNFDLSEVTYEGIIYPTVEHGYQAQKTFNESDRRIIAAIPADKANKAKYAGRKVLLRPDWENIKFQIMYELVTLKFRDKRLRRLLLATGDAQLIEGNWWNDKIFGVCKGEGLNWLGRILMLVRAEIVAERKLNQLTKLLELKSIKRSFKRR